jgi:hypothetical protein
MVDNEGTSHPLSVVVKAWTSLIHAAERHKDKTFGRYAREAMQFFDGDHNWMWESEYQTGKGGYLSKGSPDSVKPLFLSSTNKVSEIVQLFSPRLIARDPHVQVSIPPKDEIHPAALGDMNDPQFQQKFQMLQQREAYNRARLETHADIRQRYLNWLQLEGRKKEEVRECVTEALIKGEAPLWTEMYNPPGSTLRYPKTFHDSVDNLIKDPDARKRSEMKWVARKCTQPIWQVAKEYGIDPKLLKGNGESARGAATSGTRPGIASDRNNGKTNDLLTYYKIYSKTGFGARLEDFAHGGDELKEALEQFGDNCFLVVADGVEFPLNLPPGTEPEQVQERVQWPIPFWTDGGWPFQSLGFTNKPNDVWYISIVKPGIGELRFINWAMSHLATKVAQAGTIIAIKEGAGEDYYNNFMERAGAYTVMKTKEIDGNIRDNVEVFNLQAFNSELYQVVLEVMNQFDKRTGLIEILYGVNSGTQIRSASESNSREQNATIRVDDMNDRTEDFLSNVFRNEMVAASWTLTGEDIRRAVGDLSAHVWDTQMRTQDFESVVRDYNYRIEAGSAAKPNKQSQQDKINNLAQVMMPTLSQMVGMGQVGPYNAMIRDIGKAHDIDPTDYLVPPPQPIAPPPQQGNSKQ